MMFRRTVLMGGIVSLLCAPIVMAELAAYDNLDNTNDQAFVASSNNRRVPAIDDLNVVQGGALTEVSFAIIADSLGGAVDAEIILAEDDGDGIPDFLRPGAPDSILLQTTVNGVNGPFGFIPTGNALEVDVDVSGEGVSLTNGSKIWAFLSLTQGGLSADVNQVLYGPIATGSSDALVYQLETDGSIGSVMPGSGETNAGLGWALTVVPEPTAATMLLVFGVGTILRRRRK